MAQKKESEDVALKATFTKEKILQMNKYKHRVDLLNVLLEDGKTYTFEDVDAAIDNFMKERKGE